MLTLIIKNSTASAQSIADLGLLIPASGQVNFTSLFVWNRGAPFASTDLITAINGDLVVLNNGTADITKANSVAFLHQFAFDLDTSLVPDATNYRYCTDAQKTVITNTSGTNSGDVTLATNSGLGFGSGQTLLAIGTPSSITTSSTNSITTNTHAHAISGFATGAGSASGANSVDVTLATNSGLAISGQQLNMGTPTSITSTSTNNVTTNTHTHAIDSTIVTTATFNSALKSRMNFGRSGTIAAGTFLQCSGVQTSSTYGAPTVTAGTLFGLAVMCSSNVAVGGATIDVWVNGASVATLNIVAGSKTAYTNALAVAISANSWISVRNAASSANSINNPIVTLEFQ